MVVYHGSDHIIEFPEFKGGRRTNDYGYGFYTTENPELAGEWACSNNRDGFVNSYDMDIDGLSVLNLNSSDYNILNWLAILVRYRTYWQKTSIAEEAKDYLHKHFYIEPEDYDVIIGYRADDSYFAFAQDFVAGVISLSKLSEAMRLGKLGEQIVLKSRKAFSFIRFLDARPVHADIYFEKKSVRDREARRAYRNTKASADSKDDIFMIDIMRGGIENGDPRLR